MLDLLQAIPVPFDDPKHLYFSDGDPSVVPGGPAFGVRAGSNIRAPFALIHMGADGGDGDGEEGVFDGGGGFVVRAHFKPADEQVPEAMSIHQCVPLLDWPNIPHIFLYIVSVTVYRSHLL